MGFQKGAAAPRGSQGMRLPDVKLKALCEGQPGVVGMGAVSIAALPRQPAEDGGQLHIGVLDRCGKAHIALFL